MVVELDPVADHATSMLLVLETARAQALLLLHRELRLLARTSGSPRPSHKSNLGESPGKAGGLPH